MTLDPPFVEAVTAAVRQRNARLLPSGEIAFTCINPKRHQHGDAHPSRRWNPMKATHFCDVCGDGGGAWDLALKIGVFSRQAVAAHDRAAAHSHHTAGRQRETARWTIRDATGRAVAVHVRLEPGRNGRPKDYAWFRADGRTKGLPADLKPHALPLYGAHDLAAAAAGSTVALVEGEPPRDALTARGILAVATVTGAGATPRDEVLRVLEGRDVMLWPDADAPGRAHMRCIAGRLEALGIDYRVFDPWPDATNGRDAADWTGPINELRTLLLESPGLASEPVASTDTLWPDPVALEGVEVPPFPIDALPPVLADMVRDVAAVTQTPPDLAGSMGLCVVGAAGSRRADVAIGLASNPTHVEPLNLYVACVAASGTRKGPAQRAMSAPLRARERELRKEMMPKIAAERQRRRAAEKRLERLTDKAAKAKTANCEKVTQEAEQLARELPVVPAMPTLIVSDRTTEKLELDLAEQGGALLLEDEEAGTLFAIAAGRYSRDGSVHVDVFLKAYDRGTIDTARIGRDPVHIETPELSISITPQPIILQQLRERPEFHHRGFLPRFLFAVPPSLVGIRRYDEAVAPNSTIRAAYADMVRNLCTAPPKKQDGDDLEHLRIEGPALAVWKEYERRVEQEQRDGERLAPIREWASKQAGRVARLAGVLHLIETVGMDSVNSVDRSPAIPARTVEAACRLGEYFEGHALAAYDVMGTLPVVDGARRVLAWIKREAEREDCWATFSERDAARALGVGRDRFFPKMDDLRPCLRLLVEHAYLRQTPPLERPGPGQKPSPSYEVNPQTLRSCRQNRQNSSQPAPAGDSVNSVNEFLASRAPHGAPGREVFEL